MPERIARQMGYVGLGIQPEKGTPQDPQFYVKFSEGTSLTPEIDVEQYPKAGSRYSPGDTYKMRHRPQGNFTCHAWPQILGAILAWWFGKEAFTPGTPDEHIFTCNEETLPWVTIERAIDKEFFERIEDARCSELVLAGSEGNPVTLTANFLALNSKSIADPLRTVVYEEYPIMPFIFWMGELLLTVEGAQQDISADIASFSITLTNELFDSSYGMSKTRQDIPYIRKSGTASLTVRMKNQDDYYKTIYYDANGNPKPLPAIGAINLTMVYTTDEATPVTKKFIFEVPRISIQSAPIEHDPGATEPHQYEIASQIQLDPASDFVKATLENCHDAAYLP